MSAKPKRGTGGRVLKRKDKDTPEKQSARFIATAVRLGLDKSGVEFEKAMSVIARPPPANAGKRQKRQKP